MATEDKTAVADIWREKWELRRGPDGLLPPRANSTLIDYAEHAWSAFGLLSNVVYETHPRIAPAAISRGKDEDEKEHDDVAE